MAKLVNCVCCLRGQHHLFSGVRSSQIRSRLKLVAETEKQRDIISVAVVPFKQR